jgi:hypothetical protein
MSCLFIADGATVWNPSNTVARLFKGQAEAAASAFHIPSGLSAIIEDEVEIDVPLFGKFLKGLVEEYDRTTHYILKSLTSGVIGTSYVILERAGGELPEIDPRQMPAWPELHREYSRSMPR